MKRFTETGKWQDPWFRKLSPVAKLLWCYLCDCCDNSGVIDLDVELASFQIGEKITKNHLSEIGARIQLLDNQKWWIPKFVGFQFGKLTLDSRVHQAVVRTAKEQGVFDELIFKTQEDSPSRKRITPTFRDSIFALDKYKCQWCGELKEASDLVPDHVVAVSKGGSNDESNIVTCCKPCNSKKWNFDPLEYASSIGYKGIQDRLSKILDRVAATPKDKEKEKDKDKDIGEGMGGDGQYPEIQDLEASISQAELAGVPRDFAQYVYDDWSGRDGRDGAGVVVKFPFYVKKRWTRECGEWKAGNHRGKKTLNGSARVAGVPTYREVYDYAKEKFGDNPSFGNWACGFFSHWNNPKRQWKRGNVVIDWKIEFGKQAAIWRGASK